jgi:nucleoside-diphosphate-sugar epimerase
MRPPEAARILVTGSMGFVGNAVSELLLSKGLNVVTHARRQAPGIDWAGDLNGPSMPSIPDGLAAVVHCAAAIPSRSNAFVRDNADATAHLATLLIEARSLRRVVNLSSVAVYKRPRSGRWIISEDADLVDVDDQKVDSYARSKRAAELALDMLARRRPDVSVTHLRASSIYGPGMVLNTLLPTCVAHALRDEPIRLRGPRAYAQNFVHVQDVATLAAALILGDHCPSVVNAFSDDTYELFALADLIKTRLASRSHVVDETDETDTPTPVFVNVRAKRIHPRLRRLADHLRDAA